MQRRHIIQWGAAALTAVSLGTASAQSFPAKPVKLVIAFPAGGPTDISMRVLADNASKILGQPVIVENKPGASGTLGPATMAASAKPDGYTISHMAITVLRVPVMQKVAFDPMKDFTWIMHMSGFQFATFVRADSPFKTFKDLVDFARANPGKLTYGTPGAGTSLHIGMELIAKHSGVKLTQVPFKGTVEALPALEGGHVMAVAGGSEAWPLVQAGRIRALVAWTEKRNPRIPDVPTLKELGYPFVFDSPYGMAGPKGMDPAIVKRLHDAIKKAMADPKTIEVRNRFSMEDRYMDTATYAAFNKDLYEKERKSLIELSLARKD